MEKRAGHRTDHQRSGQDAAEYPEPSLPILQSNGDLLPRRQVNSAAQPLDKIAARGNRPESASEIGLDRIQVRFGTIFCGLFTHSFLNLDLQTDPAAGIPQCGSGQSHYFRGYNTRPTVPGPRFAATEMESSVSTVSPWTLKCLLASSKRASPEGRSLACNTPR